MEMGVWLGKMAWVGRGGGGGRKGREGVSKKRCQELQGVGEEVKEEGE